MPPPRTVFAAARHLILLKTFTVERYQRQFRATLTPDIANLVDRMIGSEVAFRNLHAGYPDWVHIRVDDCHNVCDPAVEATIAAWVEQTCDAASVYNLGQALFARPADAALFRLFWG